MLGRAFVLVLALVGLFNGRAAGEPLRRDDVPEALRPWIEWALQGHEDALCSSILFDAERRQCAWPSRLELMLDEHGGAFSQQWDVQRDLWVSLPGAVRSWPQEVTVDGAPAVVIDQGGAPRVRLEHGRHTVGGRFAWDSLPEMLPVPASTGLLSLTLRGQPVPFPDRDADGHLWLRRRAEAVEESDGDRVGVIVHRLIDDEVPLLLDTRIQLEVSGKAREVSLGPVLPAGFTPMALESPLPARFEADGRLRLQVRAGRWTVRTTARHDGPAPTLAAPSPQGDWASSEIWVFQAHPDLRLVTVEDADAVDPQQTELPSEWRSLPAYAMPPGKAMRLVERRRGDAGASPDQLSLSRTLWLDFDGGGYTMHDRITGTLTRAWRLDMAPPTELGRVAVGGADQFITRLGADTPAGVEIRAGALDLDADSRLDGARDALPVVGWLHDFQSLSAQLQLPPGWRLLHATGVDQARPTWVATWTLLDLFVVLITALATARLFGWAWGLLALLAVGLTYTEPNSPGGVWLFVLAAEALLRVVSGRARPLLQVARIIAVTAVAIIAVPFLVGRLRQSLYPALEHPSFSIEVGAEGQVAAAAPASGEEERAGAALDRAQVAESAPSPSLRAAKMKSVSYEYAAVDPKSIVQTGPGLPGWRWNPVALEWSGPVDHDQRLRLFLLAPIANLILAVVQTILLALLVARLIGLRPRGSRTVVGCAALAVLSVAPANADFPSDALLEQLRARLLEPPACHPSCAGVPRMRLEIDAEALRARLQIDVASPTAVPLPGQAQHWLPRTVVADGQGAQALMQGADGVLWLRLDAGTHDVTIEGPLPPRDTVQIVLPVTPRRVDAQVSGWTLDGVHGDGVADANLQLTRTKPAEGAPAAPLQADQLPPFARVERTLRLGLTWQLETHVVRVTPPDSALVLSVPLLAGESVTTADVRVSDGRAQINLAPHVGEASWQSTLAERSPIELRAPESSGAHAAGLGAHAAGLVSWVEVWQLDTSPIWHVDAAGIAPVLRADPNAPPLRTWRPWPGESVTLAVARPQGVSGQTLTIDESELWVHPGLRATDGSLSMTVRSSRGAQHSLTLPESAELLSVTIDGIAQPVRQEGRAVVLPIDPGAQKVDLRWRQPGGIDARFAVPVVDLGAPSVNAHARIAVPPSRWILFAGGPRLGPAVLFWSLLPVLALIAVGLGRVHLTPLRTHHWLLLGIGLTQVPITAAAVVAGWLLALGWRRERGPTLDARPFDLVQLMLAGWTIVAIGILFFAIQQGLLGQPEMQIAGNGSSAALLRWYQDRSGAVLPRPWVVSTPLLVYRLLMLAWALWIAAALLRWLRWGWESFGTGGYWRPLRSPKSAPIPDTAPDVPVT